MLGHSYARWTWVVDALASTKCRTLFEFALKQRHRSNPVQGMPTTVATSQMPDLGKQKRRESQTLAKTTVQGGRIVSPTFSGREAYRPDSLLHREAALELKSQLSAWCRLVPYERASNLAFCVP
jgi:hypothetical protein